MIVFQKIISYSRNMKITLFICISLLASLLHAAVMPVSGMGDSSITQSIDISMQHSPEQHAAMIQGDNNETEGYCPEYNDSCCLTLVIQADSVIPITLALSEENYASLSVEQPALRPESLYKPPKFYLASTA